MNESIITIINLKIVFISLIQETLFNYIHGNGRLVNVISLYH